MLYSPALRLIEKERRAGEVSIPDIRVDKPMVEQSKGRMLVCVAVDEFCTASNEGGLNVEYLNAWPLR